jgi:CcmD family protein
MIAYSIIWAVIFGYLVVQYSRITKIEREVENLKEALKKKKS